MAGDRAALLLCERSLTVWPHGLKLRLVAHGDAKPCVRRTITTTYDNGVDYHTMRASYILL